MMANIWLFPKSPPNDPSQALPKIPTTHHSFEQLWELQWDVKHFILWEYQRDEDVEMKYSPLQHRREAEGFYGNVESVKGGKVINKTSQSFGKCS